MPHPADDPKVQLLLREADAAIASRADPTTLAAVHMHLGIAYHEAVRRSRAAEAREVPGRPAPGMLPADEDESAGPMTWTNEVETDERGGWNEDTEMPQGPLFDSDELDEITHFPDNSPDDNSFGLDAAEAWPDRDATFALPDELRALFGLPGDLSSPDDLSVEASRVQWATSDLDGRFGALAPPALAAVLGLLAARANLLAERLDVSVGPKLAIDRLRRWRAIHALPQVAGIEDNPLPERGSWEADARSWWALFDAS